MRRKLTALLLFAFVLFVLSEAKAEKYGEYLNQEVSEITLKLPPGFVERKIRRMLKVKVGKRFTRRRIRRSINKIYLNGGVANVRIMPSATGTRCASWWRSIP